MVKSGQTDKHKLLDPHYAPWQMGAADRLGDASGFFFWAFFAATIFTTQFVLVWLGGETHNGMTAFGIYCILIAAFGILPGRNWMRLLDLGEALSPIVKLPESEMKSWYGRALAKLFSGRRDFIAFVFIGVPASYVLYRVTGFFRFKSEWFGSTLANWFGMLAFVVFMFLAAHFIAFAVGVTILVRKIGRLPIAIPIIQYRTDGIHAVGKLMIGFATQLMLMAAGCYIGLWLSPTPMNWMTLGYAGFLGIVVICFFLPPQIGIHQMMVEAKISRLRRLAPEFENAMEKLMADPSNDNLALVERLDSIKQRIQSMREWPFEVSGLIQVLASSCLPLIPSFWEMLHK